jgi:hypothetical protein
MKIQKNDKIKFLHISELTGKVITLQGTVLGFGAEVRKMWPEEMAEAPDDYLLVWRRDIYGNEQHHAVAPEDIIQQGVVVNAK